MYVYTYVYVYVCVFGNEASYSIVKHMSTVLSWILYVHSKVYSRVLWTTFAPGGGKDTQYFMFEHVNTYLHVSC